MTHISVQKRRKARGPSGRKERPALKQAGQLPGSHAAADGGFGGFPRTAAIIASFLDRSARGVGPAGHERRLKGKRGAALKGRASFPFMKAPCAAWMPRRALRLRFGPKAGAARPAKGRRPLLRSGAPPCFAIPLYSLGQRLRLILFRELLAPPLEGGGGHLQVPGRVPDVAVLLIV